MYWLCFESPKDWLCFESPKGVCVVLVPASSLIAARMQATMAGLAPGTFKEGHALDAKMARREEHDRPAPVADSGGKAAWLAGTEARMKRPMLGGVEFSPEALEQIKVQIEGFDTIKGACQIRCAS